MRLLGVGGGGREHALVETLYRSPMADEIFAAPGNPGMAPLAALAYLRSLPLDAYPIVVKADGLAEGKGVAVASSYYEAEEAVRNTFAGAFGLAAGQRLIIEEHLKG